jgi:threonine-phosphate decarboxylase
MSELSLSLAPPMHGGNLREISQHFGIPVSELLDFSANLNAEGPPQAVHTALEQAIRDPDILSNYPDPAMAVLRSALASYAGVHTTNILIGNGIIPLLDATVRARGLRKCLVPMPSFVEYRQTLENCGTEIIPFPLIASRDFKLDPDVVLSEIEQNNCDSLLLANPQNPSGVLSPASELLPFILRTQELGIPVLLDEAFIDYAIAESVTSHAPKIDNLIVFRSVTKFFALAGLRVAYAVAEDKVCDTVSAFIPPWPVGTLEETAVCAALQDRQYQKRAVRDNELNRQNLRDALSEIGLHSYPSAGNYLLLKLPQLNEQSIWEQLIERHHIAARNCENFEGLDQSFLRVAVRSPRENTTLVAALRDLLHKTR